MLGVMSWLWNVHCLPPTPTHYYVLRIEFVAALQNNFTSLVGFFCHTLVRWDTTQKDNFKVKNIFKNTIVYKHLSSTRGQVQGFYNIKDLQWTNAGQVEYKRHWHAVRLIRIYNWDKRKPTELQTCSWLL